MLRLRNFNALLFIGLILFLLASIFLIDQFMNSASIPTSGVEQMIVDRGAEELYSEDHPVRQSFLRFIENDKSLFAFKTTEGLMSTYIGNPRSILRASWQIEGTGRHELDYPVLYFREDGIVWQQLSEGRSISSDEYLISIDRENMMHIISSKDVSIDNENYIFTLWRDELPAKELADIELIYPAEKDDQLYGTWIVLNNPDTTRKLHSFYQERGFNCQIIGGENLIEIYLRQLSFNLPMRYLSILVLGHLILLLFLYALRRIKRLPEERIYFLLGVRPGARLLTESLHVIIQNALAYLFVFLLASIFNIGGSLVLGILTILLTCLQLTISTMTALISHRRYRYV